MAKKIYVGNLPFRATEDSLRQHFGQQGEVISVAIVTDRDTGQSRGFGFVEMADADADKAIAALDGSELEGRSLKVNEAKPREDNRSRGGGGGGGRRDDRGGRGGGGGSRW
ncbi:MAG: RNA-binding protein [Deltaproteobacteria bacterium]|nr:RNA-binding protein [Deltaproteobacteria bacterium]